MDFWAGVAVGAFVAWIVLEFLYSRANKLVVPVGNIRDREEGYGRCFRND